ncbi:MAG: HRDC domain-containing protein [Planctomycetota bacterium]
MPTPTPAATGLHARVLTLRYTPERAAVDDQALIDLTHRSTVTQIEARFFEHNGAPVLLCLVTYQTGPPGVTAPATTARRDRRSHPRRPVDGLPAEDRPRFEALRAWRAARAREDGVPPYVILTDRELCAVVATRPRSITALVAIDGIGPAKAKRYGGALLAELQRGPGTAPPPRAPALEPPPARTAQATGGAS